MSWLISFAYTNSSCEERLQNEKFCPQRESISRPLNHKSSGVSIRPSKLIYNRQFFHCAIYRYIIPRDRVFSLCRVFSMVVKASAHSFKRFTSRLLKLSFSLSLCTYYLGWMSCLISFERCQSSWEEHGTSENYKKNLAHGRIRTTNIARPPDYKSTDITTRRQLAWYEIYIYI